LGACLLARIAAPRDAARQQPLRPHQQRRQQQTQRQRIGKERGNVTRGELLGDAEKEAAGDGARQRVHAADGDGDEAGIGEEAAGIELERHDGGDGAAADGGNHRRGAEAEERQPRHIDTEKPRGERILGAGGERPADGGPRQHVPCGANDERAGAGDPERLRRNGETKEREGTRA